jgi:5'(3')-deoxyribonucleotidase
MKRIAVDMDEVIADALGEHLRRYNRDFNEALTEDQLTGRKLWEVVQSDRHDALEAYLRSEDFFAVLGVMPQAQRVMRALQERYQVFIATAAMEVPTSFTPKYKWLAEHFPFIPPQHIVFCGDKNIIRADYLIDDNPRQLRRFEGQGILYTAHHNVDVTGFRRVNNWLDVETLFLGDDAPPAG